jgi:hypothetical protein
MFFELSYSLHDKALPVRLMLAPMFMAVEWSTGSI